MTSGDLRGTHLMFVTAVPTAAFRYMAPIAVAARRAGARTSLVLGAGCDLTKPPGFDEVHTIRAHRRRGPIRIRQAAGDLAALADREGADLLHLHTPFSVMLGRMAGQIAGIPSVAVIHGTPLDSRGAGSRLFSAVEGRWAKTATRIVTINQEDFEAYQRFAPQIPVSLAPAGGAGVPMPFVTRARPPRSQRPLALFLGRPAQGKNLPRLVEAWRIARREVPNLRLRVIGAPAEGDQAPEPVDSGDFTLIPREHDALTEITAADILVSASAREGFPMAVAEAMSQGIPAAVVTNRGAREVARGVTSGLFLTEPTPQALALGMIQALDARVELRPGAPAAWSQAGVVDFHLAEIRAALAGFARAPSGRVGGGHELPTGPGRAPKDGGGELLRSPNRQPGGRMTQATRIRINTPNVVGEEFEGEVVAVNLESGTYFSLLGSAADIWRLLSRAPATAEAIVAGLHRSLDCTGVDVAADVQRCLAELSGLDLLTTKPDTAPAVGVESGDDEIDLTERRPYQPPRVEAFNDLQDILLLDPIHDVDEAGWPMAAPPTDAPQ